MTDDDDILPIWAVWADYLEPQTKKEKRTMDIDSLTVGELKQLKSLLSGEQASSKRLPMPIGAHVLIRTVTHYYTGRVIACSEEEVQLADAAWIADTGRFCDSKREGDYSVVDPYPEGDHPVINRSAIVDWSRGPNALPRTKTG